MNIFSWNKLGTNKKKKINFFYTFLVIFFLYINFHLDKEDYTVENESLITHKVDVRPRKYGSDRHPRLIIEELGNRYVVVEITHEKRRGQRKINYRLQRNPLGENRPAYVRRTAEIRKEANYIFYKKYQRLPRSRIWQVPYDAAVMRISPAGIILLTYLF